VPNIESRCNQLKLGHPQMMPPNLLIGTYYDYAKLLRKRGENDRAAQYEDQFEKLMKKIDPKGLMPRD
jgi:hypothetical protein